MFSSGPGGQGITAAKHSLVSGLGLLPLPSLHLSHLSELFALSQTVKIKLPDLKLIFLSLLVLGSSQICLQSLRSPCGSCPGQALQSFGILLEQNIGIFCPHKLWEVIQSFKGEEK